MKGIGIEGLDIVSEGLSLLSRIKTRCFTLVMAGRFGSFGRGSRVAAPLRFAQLRGVAVGERVNISRDVWILTVGPLNQDGSPKLVISSHCGIGMGATLSAARRVVLEEHVLMARNVYISDHGHEFRNPDAPVSEQGITEPKEVVIGSHTWLGQNACVLPGVHLGKHCVVGSNSVVTRDVPDYSVVAGVPAVVVRRFDPELRAWVRPDRGTQEKAE